MRERRKKRRMAAGVRNWAELLPELLGSISERLEAIDCLSFGAVCSSWAAAAASSLDSSNRPKGMPFLLHLGLDRESCALVNIHDRRTRSIGPLPEMRDKWFVGSQDGWLAILDKYSEVSLLNPLTRARIQLPSIATIPGVEPVYNPDGSIKEFITKIKTFTLDKYRSQTFKKIVLSSRPITDSYTAMAIFSDYNHALIATAASGKWTALGHTMTKDIIYRDGMFLLLSEDGGLWALDTTIPYPEMKLIEEGRGIPGIDFDLCSYDKFLVDSSGDLLRVDEDYQTMSFEVMKFDPHDASWVALKSLGDRSLFVGTSYSISLSIRDFPMLKPNCVYFTEVLWDLQYSDEMQIARNIGVFNMEDGSLDSYYPSDARLNWPPPLWFTPSLL